MNTYSLQRQQKRSARILMHPAASRTNETTAFNQSRISVPVSEGYRLLEPSEVLYVKAESNYCQIQLINGKSILISKTLKWLEHQLPRNFFVRTHASYIAGCAYVNLVTCDYVCLDSGDKIPVSRNRKTHVKRKLVQPALLNNDH